MRKRSRSPYVHSPPDLGQLFWIQTDCPRGIVDVVEVQVSSSSWIGDSNDINTWWAFWQPICWPFNNYSTFKRTRLSRRAEWGKSSMLSSPLPWLYSYFDGSPPVRVNKTFSSFLSPWNPMQLVGVRVGCLCFREPGRFSFLLGLWSNYLGVRHWAASWRLFWTIGHDSTEQRSAADALGFRPKNVTQEMVRFPNAFPFIGLPLPIYALPQPRYPLCHQRHDQFNPYSPVLLCPLLLKFKWSKAHHNPWTGWYRIKYVPRYSCVNVLSSFSIMRQPTYTESPLYLHYSPSFTSLRPVLSTYHHSNPMDQQL